MKWTGMIAAAGVLLLACAAAYGTTPPAGTDTVRRADIVVIDGMKSFGRLERPPVVFLHDKHTEALKDTGKDCSACHMKDEKGRMSLKYQRLEDVDRDVVMNVYHDNCIACHTDTLATGKESGPLTCGECHVKSPSVESAWLAIGMDKSLHYRHVKASEAMQKDCGLCHHEYDETAKSLFYAKGKEGSCRYCHKEVREENRASFRVAAHMDCVSCHRDTAAQKKDSGPMTCAGCHDAEAQKAIAVLETVPRMERNQPDAVFVKAAKDVPRNPDGSTPIRTNAVPFNHKGHEAYSESCRVCHHASLASCNDCHTVSGHKDGDFVKLAEAMHLVGDNASCIGCHANEQRKPDCAGCHAFIEASLQPQDAASCRKCHAEGAPLAGDVTGSDEEKALAAEMLAARTTVTETYPDADIPEKALIDKVDLPETVKIDKLSARYDAVEMPHRKIVKSLQSKIGEDRLAAYFHADPGTICQGCHHKGPVTKNPPQCASCHGKPFDEKSPNSPGLLGAYHQQCMGCHEQMQLTQHNECSACHKEKEQ